MAMKAPEYPFYSPTRGPEADGIGSYRFALYMMRLRAIITGERWATEHDEFNLHDAAMLARILE